MLSSEDIDELVASMGKRYCAAPDKWSYDYSHLMPASKYPPRQFDYNQVRPPESMQPYENYRLQFPFVMPPDTFDPGFEELCSFGNHYAWAEHTDRFTEPLHGGSIYHEPWHDFYNREEKKHGDPTEDKYLDKRQRVAELADKEKKKQTRLVQKKTCKCCGLEVLRHTCSHVLCTKPCESQEKYKLFKEKYYHHIPKGKKRVEKAELI